MQELFCRLYRLFSLHFSTNANLRHHRLNDISRCESINHHVRKLTLCFEILPKVTPSPERYLQWLYHQQCFQHPSEGHLQRTYPSLTFANIGSLSDRCDWTEERIRLAYEAYKHGIEEQSFMETTSMDVIALAASFSRLENLRSIVITSDYYGLMTDPTDVPRDMAVLIKELLLLPIYNREMRDQDAGRRQLRNIIRAAWATNITELTLSDSNNTMTPRILALRPEDLSLAIKSFRHVKKFYFKLPDFNSKEEDGDIFAAGQLAKLVQAMGCLEELTLVSSSYNPYVPWSSICGVERLPFLRVLDLQSFDFQEKEFIDFLIRHKMTLRVVKLFCVEMYSGTFASLFQNMRENLSLTSLELTGVLEDTLGNFMDYSYAAAQALGDFVTRRSRTFPMELLQRHQRGSSADGE